MEVTRKNQSRLETIKTNVRRAHDYFRPNYDRFNEFRRFVFESSLTPEEITLLMTLSKPQLEFNILEAYISRLLGEFSKQEPDIMVHADDENNADPMTIEVLEQHLRHTLCDSKNHHTKYEVYKDLLSGGFSGLKVTTDYANPMSFRQVINIDRVYDPTLCGYDQLARLSHKGDGRFWFELFPMEKEDFMEEYPDINIEKLNFRRDFGGFNWSYMNDTTPTLIVADYYDKKKKEVKILELSNGKTMTVKEYEEMEEKWADITQIPQPIGKMRKTCIETIHRTRCIDNAILEEVDTDFTHSPIIFVDGNSIMIKTPKNGNVHQVTRPYVYHAKGAQRLKNYAGISLANEIENTIQHKFIIKKEALPKEEEWLQPIKDWQKPSNIVVNAFFEQNPEMPIPDPIREIARVPAPPEIGEAFVGSDKLIQNVLGSYDASLGINNNQLSGIAIVEAASQSNATAMPYIVGYLQGYQRAAQVYTDLFPKYCATPRTIPVMDKDGQRSYIKINQKDGVDMFYDSNALNVIVKAGASFQVQKSRTIMMIKEISSISPQFAQFIADKGLNFVLDNMEGKGIEQLKSMVDEWQKEMQQQKQIAMQTQMQELQNNPQMVKNQIAMQKLRQDDVKNQSQLMIDMKKLQADLMKVSADLEESRAYSAIQLLKTENERFTANNDANLKHKDMAHRHAKEAVELHHKINQPTQQGAL
jgi:hypothetical protein